MEMENLERETTNKTIKNMSIQKRIFQTKNLIIMFFGLIIIGSGYSLRLNDIHERESKAALQSTTKSINRILDASNGKYKLARAFYEQYEFHPLWTNGFQENIYAKSLEGVLSRTATYGIPDNENLIKDLDILKEKMLSDKPVDKLSNIRAEYEIKLSEAAIRTLIQLDKGIMYYDTLKNDSCINVYVNYLLKSIQSENFNDTFLAIQPKNIVYKQLVKGLKSFLERSSLSKTKNEIDKDNFASVKEIAIPVFYELGYISDNQDIDSVEFINTLKVFQKYHGIKESGELNKKTISALAKSSYERYEQMVLNIERARSEGELGETYVYVNIPSYNLRLYNNGNIEAQHRAMVGKPDSQTPVLSSKMEFMVANPKWFVPKSITSGEILQKLKKDSTYLEKRNFVLLDKNYQEISQSDINWSEVNKSNFNYKIYQESGSGNALGKIKFMFPNDYSVYVHDTQSKKLFNNEYRAYSHGCVRLENPLDFADHLLTHIDTENFYKTIKPLVKSKKTKEIRFTEPIDIHIRYYTCEVDENNRIYFFDDIYDKDGVLSDQLFPN